LLTGLDLKDKPVAVFGLGDAIGYGEFFCDAMEEIYSTCKATGAKMVGHWPTDSYDHEGSKVCSLTSVFMDGHLSIAYCHACQSIFAHCVPACATALLK